MAYAVEKGVPLPSRGVTFKTEDFNFGDLSAPGDSFFVPGAKKSVVWRHAKTYGDANKVSLVVRLETRDGVDGVRVWRKS